MLRAVNEPKSPGAIPSGFVRTVLAGPGRSLTEAFARLPHTPFVSSLVRHPGRELLGARLESGLGQARGYYEFLQIGHSAYVVIENLSDVGPRFERAPGEGMLSFHVRLTGEYATATGQPNQSRFRGPHLGAKFQPVGVEVPIAFEAARSSVAVTMFLRPEFMANSIARSESELPPQLTRLLQATAPDVSYCSLPVSAEIMDTVHKMVECPFSRPTRLVYLESKAYDLACHVLHSFERLAEQAVEQFSEADVRRFYRAREILETRFNPPPTITSIARELGINETKLKTGFKALFGHTVFDFGHGCRMRHALHLLRDRRMRVALVSEAVGYQHQGTFACAFRNYFGTRPKDVLRPPRPTEA